MYRRRIEDRVQFTNEQKKEMLKKSKFRCCHCGKKIDIGNDFSVEHVIPLSKGGSNKPSNMLALCYRCNHLKGNMIYNPKEFYKYLNTKDLDTLIENMDNYLDKFNWFNRYNLFPYDVMYFDYMLDLKIGGRLAKGGYGKYPIRKVVLKKAIDTEYYSDFDRIYEFVRKYNKQFGIGTQGLKGLVEKAINDGCCYYLTFENSEDIIMVVPVSVSSIWSNRTQAIYIKNIMAFRDSEKVGLLMAEIIDTLIREFVTIAEEMDCKVVPFFIEVNKEQYKVIELFSSYFNCTYTDRITYVHNSNIDYDEKFIGLSCLAISSKIKDLQTINLDKELEKYTMMADEKLAEPMGMRWRHD